MTVGGWIKIPLDDKKKIKGKNGLVWYSLASLGRVLTRLLCCVATLQLNIVEGKRQYLYDEHGRRYLDAFAGIATVCCGHCHPDVVDAITAQARRLQHSTVLYLNHAIADFAEALASKLPGDLKVRCARDCCRPVLRRLCFSHKPSSSS